MATVIKIVVNNNNICNSFFLCNKDFSFNVDLKTMYIVISFLIKLHKLKTNSTTQKLIFRYLRKV